MDYSWSRSDRYNQLRSHSLSECIQFGSGETVIAASLDSQIGYKMNRLTFKQQSYWLFFVVFHKQEFCEHVIAWCDLDYLKNLKSLRVYKPIYQS